jgi:hypothetical protein
MSSGSKSTAYLPVSEDNSSIEEKPTKRAVSSTRMKAVKKKVTRSKETKKPLIAKNFAYAVSTKKKVVKSLPPKVASAIDSKETKNKPSKLKKVVSNLSTKKRIVESLALPLPKAASTVVPKELKKKGHATKKRAVQVLSPWAPVQKEKPFKLMEPDFTTKKTIPKNSFQTYVSSGRTI